MSAHPDFLSAIGGNPQLKSLELQGVTLDGAGLAGVLFGRGKSTALGLERVHATGVKIAVPGVTLPELEATATLTPDGNVHKIVVANPSKTIAAEIQPQGGKATVDLTLAKPDALLGLPFEVETLSAKGVASPKEFIASEFDARFLDGITRGKGTLRWAGPLAFDGSFELRQVDAKRITPILVGRMQGTGVVAAQGESLEKLGPGARVDGNFTVSKGQITGVDLPRTLQSGKSVGGNTPFNEMTAQAQLDRGQLALRGVKIDAGALSANGAVDVDGGKSLAGRFAADLKTPGGNGARHAADLRHAEPARDQALTAPAASRPSRRNAAVGARAARRYNPRLPPRLDADPPFAREHGALRVPPGEARHRPEGPRSESRPRCERVLALRRARPRPDAPSARSSTGCSGTATPPGPTPRGAALYLVVPRLGTISPWSSKATDIARNCGLGSCAGSSAASRTTSRAAARSASGVARLLHDRMTETVLERIEAAERSSGTSAPRPLERVPVLDGGRGALERANAALGLALVADEIDYLGGRLHRGSGATRPTSS